MTLGDFFRVLEQDAMELLAFAQAMHDPATSDRFVLELGQALGDDAFVAEVWEEFGGRSLPPSEPEAAAKARLDLPLHEGGEPLVELLEAAPMDEPARRRDRLEERAALFEQLEQAADRARFSPAEHELWRMRLEGYSLSHAAQIGGWAEGTVHSMWSRMLAKLRTPGL